MMLYEQMQRERLTNQIVEDIFNPPLEKTVMLVDLRPRVNRAFGKCAVRVQKPRTPIAPEAVRQAVESSRQSKDRGS